MRKLGSLAAAAMIAALSPANPAQAQSANLTVDAEYFGALIKAGPIMFQENGALGAGILRAPYTNGGFVFKEGTEIQFSTEGRVLSGNISNSAKLPGTESMFVLPGEISFYPNGSVKVAILKAGSQDLNIILPIDMKVNFGVDQRFESMSPNLSTDLTYSFQNRTLTGGSSVTLKLDRLRKYYEVHRATVGVAQLIGFMITGRGPNQSPSAIVPVVAPAKSTFAFHSRNPDQAANQSAEDIWTLDGTFSINGYNFGSKPKLYMRSNRLVAVQITAPLVIDTISYPANSLILINENGKIIR